MKLKDYGILASLDPVALDQACADIVFGIKPSEGNDNRPLIERINKQHGLHTIEYAEQIGFGTRNYKLVSIDKKLQDNPSKRLVLHYDFIKANGQTVPDLTSNHFDGKLYGSAQVIHEGKEHYVSLGNEQGYIDLGEEIGFHLKGMTTFSIAVRYKVAETASLQGNGYFLWAFSTLEQNTQDRGRYQRELSRRMEPRDDARCRTSVAERRMDTRGIYPGRTRRPPLYRRQTCGTKPHDVHHERDLPLDRSPHLQLDGTCTLPRRFLPRRCIHQRCPHLQHRPQRNGCEETMQVSPNFLK